MAILTIFGGGVSSIRSIDLQFIDDLVDFIRGRGYVLDFSDSTFAEFFATELDVDIDHPDYSEYGGSKGKRLRGFLKKVEDPVAVKALKALWEHRAAYLDRHNKEEPLHNAEGRFLSLIGRLGGGPATGTPQESPKTVFDRAKIAVLKSDLIDISRKGPHERGYAFEVFLKSLFDAFGLKARQAFRNRGEQIDGSFALGSDTYLLEAKWQAAPIGAADLHSFHGKIDQKAAWARGIIISYSGFTEVGLHAFGNSGKKLICIDGLDLHDALDRQLPFDQVIERKARAAVETGHPFVRVRELFPG
jgi:hypothetical protein